MLENKYYHKTHESG